ncbi:MAG: right-handed parallel beta-helix repeat-containing protein [Bacteroidales bacterium]|nr:right-handed parallel beta-helix repeat-containing protein [Bacteroidales bacterium]
MKKLFLLLLIAVLFTACFEESANNSDSNQDVKPVDTLAMITNHIITDFNGLVLALEISNDFDTLTIADRLDCIQPISIINKNNLLIHGDYAELCLADSSGSFLIIDSCNNLIIEGLNLYFTSNEKLTPALLHVKSGKNIVLRNNQIHTSGSYGIKCEKLADSLSIEENIITNCKQYGISSCASNTRISKNTFYNNKDGFADIFLCKEIQKSAIIDTNYFMIANHDNYISEVMEAIASDVYDERESMSPEGVEKVTAYLEDDKIICLKYEYSEEVSETWMVFYNKGQLVYVEQESIEFYELENGDLETGNVSNKFFYLNGKLVKWEKTDVENNIYLEESAEYPKKAIELNASITSLIGMIPLLNKAEI